MHISFQWNPLFLPVHSRLMDDTWRHVQRVILPQLGCQLERTNNDLRQCTNIRTAINEWLVLTISTSCVIYIVFSVPF